MDAEKEKSLVDLTNIIEKCLRCYEEFKDCESGLRLKFRRWYNIDPWFFPPNGINKNSLVKGFLGTGDVVFVCMRPSTGTFPSPTVKQFYKLIENYGFQDAHITDLIKCRSRVKNEKRNEEKEVENCFEYLLKELEIIYNINKKLSLIVAVGNKAYNYLNKKLPQHYKDRLVKITHYSARGRKEQVFEKLENDFKRIHQIYHKATTI
jgi:uracil-DNA glycosylase family 4